jgi:predicted phage-related endonuclease
VSDDRKDRLGGTDIAAIAGLSPHKTPTDIFLEKTGMAPERWDDKDPEWIEWGNRFEDLVLDKYEHQTLMKLHRNRLPDGSQEVTYHAKHPIIGGALDAWAEDRVVDAKTSGNHMRHRWANNEPPEEIGAQMQVYCELKHTMVADVPVLFDGRSFRIFTVAYDPEYAGNLIELGLRFHRDHILTKRPPKPQSLEERQAQIRALYPRNRAAIKPSTQTIDKVVLDLLEARRIIDAGDVLKATAEATIKEFIGDGEGVGGDWGRILWRTSKDSMIVNWEQVARDVAVQSHFDHAQFHALVKDHSTMKPGNRPFLVQPKKDKEN